MAIISIKPIDQVFACDLKGVARHDTTHRELPPDSAALSLSQLLALRSLFKLRFCFVLFFQPTIFAVLV